MSAERLEADALEAAFLAAADEQAEDDALNAAAFTDEDLHKLSDRFGLYVAKDIKSGPWDTERFEGFIRKLHDESPRMDATLAAIRWLPKVHDSGVTVALIHTYDPYVSDGILAHARSESLLACTTDNTASVHKIASALEGNTVLHFPLPQGTFDHGNCAAVNRHATACLSALSVGLQVLYSNAARDNVKYPLRLISAAATPRGPNVPLVDTITVLATVTDGPLQGTTSCPIGTRAPPHNICPHTTPHAPHICTWERPRGSNWKSPG